MTFLLFPQENSRFQCLDNGCCSLFYLTWEDSSLGYQKSKMGCWGALSTDSGYFMYFNTSVGTIEEAALLESRILYPKRNQQCLQFFYKMTGSPSDRLVVWVRRDDSTGTVRKLVKMATFQGTWKPLPKGLVCFKFLDYFPSLLISPLLPSFYFPPLFFLLHFSPLSKRLTMYLACYNHSVYVLSFEKLEALLRVQVRLRYLFVSHNIKITT